MSFHWGRLNRGKTRENFDDLHERLEKLEDKLNATCELLGVAFGADAFPTAFYIQRKKPEDK